MGLAIIMLLLTIIIGCLALFWVPKTYKDTFDNFSLQKNENFETIPEGKIKQPIQKYQCS